MKKVLTLLTVMVISLNSWAFGEYTQYFNSGTGTEDNPYQIATMEQLCNLSFLSKMYSEFPDTYFVMTTDLSFGDYDAWSWGIGQGNRPFAGIFDAQGHKITGINTTYPLFSYIGQKGVVRNLTIDGVKTTGASNILDNTAPLADHVMGLIENCHVVNIDHDYSLSGMNYCIGGLAGYVTQTGVVRSCTTSGQAVSACNYGAIVGKNYGGKVENCSSDMAITIARSNIAIGGICADTRYYNSGAATNIVNCVFNGEIKPKPGQIYDSNRVGAICGDGSSAKIIGCVNHAPITANGYVGGIAGTVSSDAVVSECYNMGHVQDIFMARGQRQSSYGYHDYIAGIAGQITGGVIERCFNGATINSVRGAAGIAGYVSGGLGGVVSISDCYNAGLIDAPNVWKTGTTTIQKAGGIVSEFSNVYDLIIKNCLSYGTINNAVAARYADCEYVGYKMSSRDLILTNNYYDNQVVGNTSKQGSMTTAELTAGIPLQGFSTDVWQFTSGLYPRLKCCAETEAALLCATPYFLAEAETHNKVKSDFTVSNANSVTWSLSENTQATLNGNTVVVTPGEQAQQITIAGTLDGLCHESLLTIYPDMFEGNGTEQAPYLISDFADMVRLSQATNEGGLTFDGDYLQLTGDIDMQSKSDFKFFSLNEENPFLGTFDGNGHALNNLYMRNDLTTTEYGALFGYVGEKGVIKNLSIAQNSNIGLYLNGGTIAAVLQGTISDVKVLPRTIYSASAAGKFGGIAGTVEPSGRISDCYVGANINLNGAASNVAGITAFNYGLVEGCQFAGNIGGTAARYIGGLVSENYGHIDNCLASCDVTAQDNVGGVAARCLTYGSQVPSITNTLTTGQVSYSSQVECAGAAVGQNLATFEHVWYDKQIGVLDNFVAEGIEGKPTAEIIADWDGSDRWIKDGNTYPMLVKFADQPLAKFYSFPVTFAAGEHRGDLITEATVYSTTGLTSRLDDGDDFALRSGKVTPDVGTTYGYDQLILTYDGFTRRMVIGAYGKQMTSGDGTAENPWIINTAADLVKLATQSNRDLVIKHYTGKHFKLGNDITLTAAFAGITGALNNATAANNPRWFRGTIDGDGHSISGLNISSTNTYGFVGLVGHLGPDGAVKNLTIADGNIQGTKMVGSVVGKCNGIVTNVINHANVTSTTANSSAGSGGIIGYVTATAQVDNLTNYGTVKNTMTSGTCYTGGVIGSVVGDGTKTFTHISNYGEVTGPMLIGGVVANSKLVSYDNVANYGTVSGTATIRNIIGGCFGDLISTKLINNARNYANITGSTAVGGVMARYITSAGQVHIPLTITNSLNAGDIIGNVSYVGGIVGMSDTTRVTVNNCANVGNIANTAATIETGTAAAGGIMGGGSPIISNCYNAGIVSGINCIGGLLGRPVNNNAKVDITNSLNVGWLEGYNTNSANVGSVTGYRSTAATFTNVTYDNQMSDIAGAGRNDVEGITGLNTIQLVNADVRYPAPETLAMDSAVAVTTLPILLAEGNTRYQVTRNFSLAIDADYRWTADSVFNINGNQVVILPYTHGQYNVTAHYGSKSRTYPLTVDFDILKGDVNGDGIVDITDINIMINIILGKDSADNYDGRAYITDDDAIDISDINTIINIILNH